jgi:hypothetical protein
MDLWPGTVTGKKATSLYGVGSRNNINLRNEFKYLIDGTACEPQRGHWVLLRRMDTRQRCSCWNEVGEGDLQFTVDRRKYDEPDKDCEVCGGSGWIYAEELHKVRRRITTPSPGQGGLENQSDFALLHIPYIVYYFKHYVNPSDKDKIIEIENDADGNPVRPFVRGSIYNITMAEPFRELNGRIEYWRCAAKKEELRYGSTL